MSTKKDKSTSTEAPATQSTEAILQTPESSNIIIVVKEVSEEEEESADEPKKNVRFALAFMMIWICTFQAALDLVIVASALPGIATALQATSDQAYWCGTGYVLAQTVSQPIYGTLSEIFGRKPLILFSIFIFLLSSILCATAEDITWLIATRVTQGIGGGGLLTMTSLIVADMTTLRERGKYVGYIAVAYSAGCAIGTPLGAAFAEYASWRWCFYINIPICVIAFAGIMLFLHLDLEVQPFKERFWKVDWLGIIVFVGSSVSLLVGVTGGGVLYPWESVSTIAPLVIGSLGLGAFVLVEGFVSPRPMVPLTIFKQHNAKWGFLSAFSQGFVVLINNYYLILYFLGVQRLSLLQSAVNTMPVTVVATFFATTAGFIMTKTQKFRPILWSGWAMTTSGLVALSTLSPSSGFGEQIGWQVITAAGNGFLFSSISIVCQASQPDELQGIAISIYAFTRSLGQAFGIAVGGSVFQNVFGAKVKEFSTENGWSPALQVSAKDAETAFAVINQFPERVVDLYGQIYAQSLHAVWYTGLGIAALALLSSLLVKHVSLDRGIGSKQRFVPKRNTNSEQDSKPV